MGFTPQVGLVDKVEQLYMNFGPGLYIRMVLCEKSLNKYWNLYIARGVSNQIITDINYDRGETEKTIVSDIVSRMLLQTEKISTKLLSDKIRTNLL